MFGLEPSEIARLLEERVAVASSIREGLLAIDRDGRITLINEHARQMLGVGPEVLGRAVREVLPNSRLPLVTETGVAEYDQVMRAGDRLLLGSRVPIRVGDEIVGAVATFRDRSEVQRLAEELTSVQQFVKALRASNHEWVNKLHTIAGMIQLRRYDQAKEYIFATTEGQQEAARFLARRFADPRISGLLLGKAARARELGVELEIDQDSRLTPLTGALEGIDLVGIVGNLVENAIEAAAAAPNGESRVRCLIEGGDDRLRIEVEDNGPGISPELRPRILEGGHSTKGADRGMGLALVRREVELVGGRLDLATEAGCTQFLVSFDREVAVAGRN
jgi:two-component system sensor histidine kinase DctS